jgi:uncharacterized membrane protein
MIAEVIQTFLISISPFGESRVGIPFGIVSGLHPLYALAIGLLANILVFPIFMLLLDKFNGKLWRFRFYKEKSVKIAQRSKRGVGKKIQKYGFWGLMVFVMIPLPVTGAYAASIAAYIFKLKRKHAFIAISIGLAISCGIMATGAYLGKVGMEQI